LHDERHHQRRLLRLRARGGGRMKVAALYDIHGNLPALEAVLREVPEDAIVLIGGDTAAGPMPAGTLERLLAPGDRAVWIRGDADREGRGAGELWRRRTDWSWER